MSIRQIGSVVLTAAVGGNKAESTVGVAAAVLGYIATNFLGGWDTALQILIFLMIADYITGILGAYKLRLVSSEVMFWGGIRKAVVLSVVALAVLLDRLVGGEAPVFRTLALYFYAGREGLSVIENLGILGVQLPSSLKRFLEQLKDKGDGQ